MAQNGAVSPTQQQQRNPTAGKHGVELAISLNITSVQRLVGLMGAKPGAVLRTDAGHTYRVRRTTSQEDSELDLLSCGEDASQASSGASQVLSTLLAGKQPENSWGYRDPKGRLQGPFPLERLQRWHSQGEQRGQPYFEPKKPMRHWQTGAWLPFWAITSLHAELLPSEGGMAAATAAAATRKPVEAQAAAPYSDVHMEDITEADMEMIFELSEARHSAVGIASLADTAEDMEGVEYLAALCKDYDTEMTTLPATAGGPAPPLPPPRSAGAEASHAVECLPHPLLHVVVDTNVLLTDFACIDFIRRHTLVAGPGGGAATYVTVLVPWIVICELDGLKKGNKDTDQGEEGWKSGIGALARKAINTLHAAVSSGSRFLVGQPVKEFREAAQQHKMDPGSCHRATNDDRVLQCCLHRQSMLEEENARLPAPQGECPTVLLLSNDTNLCNKAIVNGIKACSSFKLRKGKEGLHLLRAPAAAAALSSPVAVRDNPAAPPLWPYHGSSPLISEDVEIMAAPPHPRPGGGGSGACGNHPPPGSLHSPSALASAAAVAPSTPIHGQSLRDVASPGFPTPASSRTLPRPDTAGHSHHRQPPFGEPLTAAIQPIHRSAGCTTIPSAPPAALPMCPAVQPPPPPPWPPALPFEHSEDARDALDALVTSAVGLWVKFCLFAEYGDLWEDMAAVPHPWAPGDIATILARQWKPLKAHYPCTSAARSVDPALLSRLLLHRNPPMKQVLATANLLSAFLDHMPPPPHDGDAANQNPYAAEAAAAVVRGRAEASELCRRCEASLA
mmetsp:Transcript_24492/g.68114  ORF Transcript_24492/g.68114 Transcript_24492/m.68114 type:complete len:789 (-) Transcript_24492:546-2912(-)